MLAMLRQGSAEVSREALGADRCTKAPGLARDGRARARSSIAPEDGVHSSADA
jgi:hypothetical protein